MVVILVLSEFGAISFELMGWEIAVGGTPLGDTTMKIVFIAIVLVVILTLPLYKNKLLRVPSS
ncbi:hypothetical protein HpHA95_11330 [Helicobacter pylori]